MHIRIRDWDKHFEQDRSRQWKHIRWVPIPNKQGSGYRTIMAQKNGLEIFACWIALVELGSTCQPRGDLYKYDLNTISLLTLISQKTLETAIKFLSQCLDWIEVIENLDKNVNECQKNVIPNGVDSSVLCNSLSEKGDAGETWKDNYNIYKSLCVFEMEKVANDEKFIAAQTEYYPRLDLRLTIKKACLNYWSTKEGWKKKKSARTADIDWLATTRNALAIKSNQVWRE
jgi:hypothetical protein